MLNIARVLKPWKEAASLNAQINLYGFWDSTTFLTKSGDLGVVLRIEGVDYESLDSGEQEYAVRRLEAALKAFGPGFHDPPITHSRIVLRTACATTIVIIPPLQLAGDSV